MIVQVRAAVSRWRDFAAEAGIAPGRVQAIGKAHRLDF